MQDPNVHREVVAAVANLKVAVKFLVGSLTAQATTHTTASIQRASEASTALCKLLSALSDQIIRLPLETSKRLVEVNLPGEVQQLLAATTSGCARQQPADTDANVVAAQWADLRLLLAKLFECLTLLASVASRACKRSPDPVGVLTQLATPPLMAACVDYMNQLWQLHSSPAPAAAEEHTANGNLPEVQLVQPPLQPAASMFVSPIAAFAGCYSQLAVAANEQQGLEQLHLQLVSSLCSTGFMATACRLILHAEVPTDQTASVQHAGWGLLSLAMFLSAGNSSWADDVQDTATSEPERHADKYGLPVAIMQKALVQADVLQFVEERLYHAVKQVSSKAPMFDFDIKLLPGKVTPDGQDVLCAVLRPLQCWRALLHSRAHHKLLATSRSISLLVAAVEGVITEPVKQNSSSKHALRCGCVSTAAECLHLASSSLDVDEVQAVAVPVCQAAARVVVAAAEYWETNKRSIKSTDLPYSGQVKCVDKATGDLLQRYSHAAGVSMSALAVVVDAVFGAEQELLLNHRSCNKEGKHYQAMA